MLDRFLFNSLEYDVQMPLSSKLSSVDQENDVDNENEKIDDYVEGVWLFKSIP